MAVKSQATTQRKQVEGYRLMGDDRYPLSGDSWDVEAKALSSVDLLYREDNRWVESTNER